MAQSKDGIARRVWLVCNAASGGNDEEAVAGVRTALVDAGFTIDRTIRFPDEPAPRPDELQAAGVGLLAVFGGDGTVHAAVAAASGWSGAVLVLPGGTMNMLAKRLHGDVPAPEIVARLAGGPPRRVRPAVIRSRHGMGLTGVLAGPGAVWNDVREAMRAADILEFVATARQAISYSASGPKVVCEHIDGGREEGYAAITVTPHDDGLEANGYYAESLGDYAGQGIALLNRNFRDGPHDELGRHGQVRLVCPEGERMGLLIDGEPHEGAAEEVFEIMPCQVDLVTTRDSGRADAR
ncbi:Diacylglycerol kinase catalytic domain-containing protein [Novosphingobium sp. CF614]|uniref:diacylglycerol/lipid kinase family protein n=1 Tax=Novosphingobium sp. CF614 TaxID=1884364 RepID=UPI0008EB83A0|nr:diacylglycerol kinase family protein [Novosphingobium sp. CF614]SFG23022.1 Diacylglycerol kinase catalytic domain-containing protein [Novosphingobium sp. CF614]